MMHRVCTFGVKWGQFSEWRQLCNGFSLLFYTASLHLVCINYFPDPVQLYLTPNCPATLYLSNESRTILQKLTKWLLTGPLDRYTMYTPPSHNTINHLQLVDYTVYLRIMLFST